MRSQEKISKLRPSEFVRYITIRPWTKEAVERAYETGLISYPTMANLIVYGKQKGDWS